LQVKHEEKTAVSRLSDEVVMIFMAYYNSRKNKNNNLMRICSREISVFCGAA